MAKWEILETQLNYLEATTIRCTRTNTTPTDRKRPSIQTYKGKRHRFSLNPELTQKLQKLSRESGTTLFMTLLAGFATLLFVIVDSQIFNRFTNS